MTAPLSDLRATVQALFPWLAGARLAPAGKGLALRSADGLLHLESDGPADPKVIRTVDIGGRLAFNSLDSTLYYSPSASAAYVPVAVYAALPGPPPSVFAGTSITLGPGSDRVTCG